MRVRLMAKIDLPLVVAFAGIYLSVFTILILMSHVGMWWAHIGAAFSTLGVSIVRRYTPDGV